MVSSKVEVSLRKADAVAWGKLEDPKFKPEPEPQDLDMGTVNIPLYVVLSCDYKDLVIIKVCSTGRMTKYI
jgi:hypothetical protein